MDIELVFIMDDPAGYELRTLASGEPPVVPNVGDAVWVRGMGWLVQSKLVHYDDARISVQMQVTRPLHPVELVGV